MRLCRRGAVQHRGALHQSDPVERDVHQRSQDRGGLGSYRAVPVGHPPQAQDEPLGPAGRFGGVWDQHPLLHRQQDDHGGQRHRPPVHRPHLRDGVHRHLLPAQAGKAGSGDLRGRAGRHPVLLCGQPFRWRDGGGTCWPSSPGSPTPVCS